MALTVGTFNLNNLFDRFNYDVEIAQLPARDRTVEATIDIVPSAPGEPPGAREGVQGQADQAQTAG